VAVAYSILSTSYLKRKYLWQRGSMNKQKVLLVDDESNILSLFGEVLEREGYGVTLLKAVKKVLKNLRLIYLMLSSQTCICPAYRGLTSLKR